MFLRKSVGGVMFAAAAVSAAKETKGEDSGCAKKATLHRAKDLPIYSTIYGSDGSRFVYYCLSSHETER